jgi:hypothetical protein
MAPFKELFDQNWIASTKERLYFSIMNSYKNKAMVARHDNTIYLESYKHNKYSQHWFWHESTLRSREYPHKVVDLFMVDYVAGEWKEVTLAEYYGGDDQKWRMEADLILSFYRNVALDGYYSQVGCRQKNYAECQKWIVFSPDASRTSCADDIEEAIYDVIQWFPFLSTLWDIFSSIGYAAAGDNRRAVMNNRESLLQWLPINIILKFSMKN